MRTGLRQLGERLLGRGEAAITVPVMDGALRPNRVLDEARVVAELPGLDDLASDGEQLWLSAGKALYRLQTGAQPAEQMRFEQPVTALAVAGRQGRGCAHLAVALGGREILLLRPHGSGWHTEARLDGLMGVNALHFDTQGRLLFSAGSQQHAPDAWCHDLMGLGRSGRVARWDWRTGGASPERLEWLAQGLGHAFGVLALGDAVLVSESWRHRVLDLGGAKDRAGAACPVSADLVGYPSRMAADGAGGFWLSCFVCRSQLVEFVLRERSYRERMLREIDPRYWIAPALSSGQSFLEPLQGAGVKQMGVLKPWAPPRSYGLVLKVAANGRVLASLHSQVDGRHHGITALAPLGAALYVAARGAGRLLRVDLDGGTNAS